MRKVRKRLWLVSGLGHRSTVLARFAGNAARIFARMHGLTLQSEKGGTFKGVSYECRPAAKQAG
jgi:hypothetical protein